MNDPDLAALLREHASRHSVPGAAVGVLQGGATTTAYFGVADVRTGAPVTAETRFCAGSLTKSMVATVIRGLAQAGQLSLDDPVAGHVPELRQTGWAERATLRDLLANRSGLPLSAEMEFDLAPYGGDERALSRLAADLSSRTPAGDFWSYSNVGWCLLGRVVETATGSSWEAAMRSRLFRRAGMSATAFGTEPGSAPRATGHEITTDGPLPVGEVMVRSYGPAGTSVVSTVTDLLRFAALHLEDRSLAGLRVVHAPLSIYGWFDAWCLGWARFEWPGADVYGWDGLLGGERSALRMLPSHRAAVVVLTNGSTGRAMYRSFFRDLAQAAFGIKVPPMRLEPSPEGAGDLSRFAGVYAWPDLRVEVTTADRGLLITTPRRKYDALALDERVFLVDASDPDNPTMTFGAFDPAGRPGVLYSMLWGYPRVVS